MDDRKGALRQTTLAARRAMDSVERAHGSAQVCRNLRSLPEMADAGVVALYAAMADECNLADAWADLARAGVMVVLPRVTSDGLTFAEPGDESRLVRSSMGVREPQGPSIDPRSIDLIVMPGAAYDLRGGRLGLGGGYYDRFLVQLDDSCTRVGVAFSCQITTRVPREDHDQPVDIVVTDMGVHRLVSPPPTTA